MLQNIISVSEKFSQSALKLEMPELTTQLRAFNWIKETYVPQLKIHIAHYEMMIDKFKLQEKLENDFLKFCLFNLAFGKSCIAARLFILSCLESDIAIN